MNLIQEISFYIQDKIEYGDMIINVGLRYEIFNPKSHIQPIFTSHISMTQEIQRWIHQLMN